MALASLNALVQQHGLEKMEEAFLRLKQLRAELTAAQARFDAALSQEELPADPVEPAVVPSPARRVRPSGKLFKLASEEKIEQIIKDIDDGHLRSETKTVSWNPRAKHYPGFAVPMEILSFMRACPNRTVTKEELLESLRPSHSWGEDAAKMQINLRPYLRELEKQGIVLRGD